ncbi:hypothetical protein GF378_01700 [Candidatus Pacearchaeota archaeon]|nr:hypothetical protein [Candidatus Pacearchaeota archaeon]
MKNIRERFNNYVKEKGNALGEKYLSGAKIGDYLTSEVNVKTPVALGLAGLLGVGSGCSTIKSKTEYESANELFTDYKEEQKMTRKELRESGYGAVDDYVKDFEKYQKEGDREANLTEKTENSDRERRKAKEDYSESYLELCDKLGVKPTGDTRNKNQRSPRDTDPKTNIFDSEMYLHIGPFLEERTPYDEEVADIDPYTITGIELELGNNKGFFNLFAGQNNGITLENTNDGTGVSEIESTMRTFGMGGGVNLINNPSFRLGLEGGLLMNNETIEGTFTDNLGNVTLIDESGRSKGLYAGAKLEWQPLDWMSLTFGAGNTWYSKDESDNTMRDFYKRFGIKFGGKF